MLTTAAKKGLVFLFLVFLLLNHASVAQDPLRILNAARITDRIKLDGKLDEAAWLNATPFEGNFYQVRPNNGAESPYRSKVYVVYDNKAIYVGALLYDPDPETIPQELGERDDFQLNVDAFAFNVDTYNIGQNGFSYVVTAAGVQADAIVTSSNYDTNWNAVWNSAVSITDEGWVVEMEIPYSAIRFPKKEEHIWGINFYRQSKRINEMATWNFIDQEVEGELNQAGELHGLSNIKPPLRLSFLPYFSAGGEYSSSAKSFTRSFTGGMDMKLGVSESFTLDMSLVPDFSQVQSDNVVLNLSPFEVRYDENRPFFTEGVELFSKGRIFYSRRIGQVRGYGFDDDLADDERIVETPFTNQLINATKVSGRTGAGTGLGLFNAVTANSYAKVEDEAGNRRESLIDPLTNFNVFVVDQNLKNNSYIGLINTNVVRVGDYRDANVTVGDFRFRDKSNTYSISGSGGLSQIFTTKEGAPLNTKGFRSRLFLAKVSGKLQYSIGTSIESDKWNINDLGFMRQNNQIRYSSRVSYNIYKPFSIFNSFSARVNFNYTQLYSPQTYIQAQYGGSVNAQLRNFYNVGFGFNLSPYDNYDYFEPREPGYYFKTSANYNFYVYVGTDRRKKLNIGMNTGIWNRPEDQAVVYFGGIGPSYRVSNRMNSTIT
jgi:uncharacterized protein DUF5916/cellulose/xylan binding protein with CBM9 domain